MRGTRRVVASGKWCSRAKRLLQLGGCIGAFHISDSCPGAALRTEAGPHDRRLTSTNSTLSAITPSTRLAAGPVFALRTASSSSLSLPAAPTRGCRAASVSSRERVSQRQRGTSSAAAQSSPPHNVPPPPYRLDKCTVSTHEASAAWATTCANQLQ